MSEYSLNRNGKKGGKEKTRTFCWKALLGCQTRRVDVADVVVKSEIYVKNCST